MHTLKQCPNQQGYSVQIGNGVIGQQLDGGLPRFRTDIKNPAHTVAVNWVVDAADYQYLLAFYYVWARNPSQPFKADLIIDNAPLEEYQCFFASPIQLDSKNGNAFMVSAQFVVKAKPRNTVMDDSIVGVRDGGGDLTELVTPLEKLANEDLPDALENVEANT